MKGFALPVASALLASCALLPAAPGVAPSVTATFPVTTTASVAFPTVIPTATWTPGPSLTPTLDLRPDSGPRLLLDTMDDPAAWELTATSSGSAAITDGRLTLSVRSPRAYHRAQRPEPIFGDFYAEIDLYTEVCQPGDEMGLTARGAGLVEQYRFLIGCDGTARITRVLEDESRALTLRQASPAILAGAPSHNRLGIWLHGLDLKFFVNGEQVLTVRDAALGRGSLGVIARAGSGGQVSAAFDDLVVFALTLPTPSPSSAFPPPAVAAATVTP